MFSLLHPAALWTLAALALPLAIHLRRPPPRTVRLGSLRSLENLPRRPWRHPRWRELLLLWTRLGLLTILTGLLAGLHWVSAPPTGPRRWALLDPTATLAGDARARWQALRAEGYEPHQLAPGFPAAAGDDPAANDAPAPDLWSLLRTADATLPAGSTLAVFTPGRLAALRGVRPALAHCRVEWITTLAPDAPHVWNVDDPARPLAGRSDAHATILTPRPAGASGSPATPPRAVSVLILHDAAHAADARYVEAAVRAGAGSLGHTVNVQTRPVTPDAENAAATDWTFWLGADTVPAGLAARAARLVRYAGDDAGAVAADGFIVAPDDPAADGVPLQKRTALPAPLTTAHTTLWTDGQGNPLLTYAHPPGAGEMWELFTRFDPAWNDLPATTALPAWLRAQLFAADAAPFPPVDPVHDRRLADLSQGPPTDVPNGTAPSPLSIDRPTVDLHWLLWTLAAGLFAAERVLSLRRRADRPTPAPRPQPEAAAAR